MSAFQTFYLLFKSNADDVIKGNKAVEKSTKDTEQALKNTRDTTQEVGLNFVKMAESAASAIGAISGFEILKSGIQQAIDLNTNLKVLADNYGTTAEKLRAAGLATQLAGGDFGTGVGNAIKMAQANRAAGLASGDPEQNIRNLRRMLTGKTPTQQQGLLNQFGITDEFTRRELTTMSGGEFEANMKRANFLSKDTNKAALAAYEANKAQVGVDASQQGFFNRLLTTISGPLNRFLDRFAALIGMTGPAAGSAAVIGGTTLAGWLGTKAITKFLGKTAGKATAGEVAAGKVAMGDWGAVDLGGATGAATAATGAAGAAAFLGGGEILYGFKKLADLWSPYIEAQIVKNMTADIISKAPLYKSAQTKKSSIDDPMQKAILDIDNHINKRSGDLGSSDDLGERIKGIKLPLNDHIARAKSVLSTASQLSPAPSGGTTNVKIDKVEVVTQANNANDIATGIAGALKDEIYSALGFLSSTIDNGQVR
jgi:hypothetical protein